MVELILRLGFSLLVVLGLVWTVARLIRGPAIRSGRVITVLSRTQLTRGSAVAVVLVADRALILGATDHGITLLAEAAPDAVTSLVPAARHQSLPGPQPGGEQLAGSLLSASTWKQTVNFIRERTVRR